jgi:peptide methionine sulfoxide reductase msrA/msrB
MRGPWASVTFVGGCFWDGEDLIRRVPGVMSATSDHACRIVEYPTHEQACTGTNGHVESVRIAFDPSRVSHDCLAGLPFDIHDLTQLGRQCLDIGTRYRSVTFHHHESQRAGSEMTVQELGDSGHCP